MSQYPAYNDVRRRGKHRTKYQESVNGNVAEICETVAETQRLTRVSAFGLVTFTRFRCCGYDGTVPLFYIFPSDFSRRKQVFPQA